MNRWKRTQIPKIIFVSVGEVVPFPCRTVKEFDINDVVCVLVCYFYHAESVVRWQSRASLTSRTL
jgi:hypothetical protein